MAKNERVVKYAGVSVVSDEKGVVTHNFHTSNNVKYAVWAKLPEHVLGTGKSVTFTWFKMPANTTKTDAVKHLLEGNHWVPNEEIKTMLAALLAKSAPKAPKPKKAKKVKKQKVTVVVTEKKLSDEDAAKVKAANLARIREAAAKRKEAEKDQEPQKVSRVVAA